jgi:hypothetical protein
MSSGVRRENLSKLERRRAMTASSYAKGLIPLFASVLTMSSTFAANADEEVYRLRGALGSARIGMTLDIKDGKVEPGSHYFYVAHLKDIPLTGAVTASGSGEIIATLREPAGPVITLHYQDKGGHPTEFLYTSNDLSGAWAFDGKTLPVTLSQTEAFTGPLPERAYADVTDESDAKFEARVRGFRSAVLSNDRAAAARYVDFPLNVNSSLRPAMTIRTSRELEAEWNGVFSKAWIKAAADAIPHDLFVKDGMAMLGNGIAWFGAKGVKVVNAQ